MLCRDCSRIFVKFSDCCLFLSKSGLALQDLPCLVLVAVVVVVVGSGSSSSSNCALILYS